MSLFSDSVDELAPCWTILSSTRSKDWFKLSRLWASKDSFGSKLCSLVAFTGTVFNRGGVSGRGGGGFAGGDEGKLARVGSKRRGLILLFGGVSGKGDGGFSNVDEGELGLVGSGLVLVVVI